MSHFAVAVFTDNPEKLNDIMAPFNEEPEDGSPYLKFTDYTDEVRSGFDPKSDLIFNGDHNGIDRDGKHVTAVYADIDEFAKDWHGYTKLNGKWGLWRNPDARWDWYEIGGLWTGLLKLRDGATGESGEPGLITEVNNDPTKADIALLSDVVFDKSGEAPTYAFIMPDGSWHEPGRMGWFGMSDETPEKRNNYNKVWQSAIASLDHSKTYIVNVDCHI